MMRIPAADQRRDERLRDRTAIAVVLAGVAEEPGEGEVVDRFRVVVEDLDDRLREGPVTRGVHRKQGIHHEPVVGPSTELTRVLSVDKLRSEPRGVAAGGCLIRCRAHDSGQCQHDGERRRAEHRRYGAATRSVETPARPEGRVVA